MSRQGFCVSIHLLLTALFTLKQYICAIYTIYTSKECMCEGKLLLKHRQQATFTALKPVNISSSSSCKCPCSLTVIVKMHFLIFKKYLMYFNLCPLYLVLSLGTTEDSLVPSSLHPSLHLQVLTYIDKVSLILLFSRLNSLNSLILSL